MSSNFTNSLSPHHLSLLLKKHYREGWKRQAILTSVIILLFSITLRILAALNTSFYEQDPHLASFIGYIFTIVIMFLCFVVLSYQTAHAMPFMETKQRHIQYNLLPASKLEKFLTIFAFPIAITIAQCIIALPIADLIQYIWSGEFTLPLLVNGEAPINPDINDNFPNIYNHAVENQINPIPTMLISGLLYHAWSLFSAAIFRKHPFLLSTVTYMAASMLLSPLLSIGFLQFANTNDYFALVSNADTITSLILTAVFYTLAYRRMSNAQV